MQPPTPRSSRSGTPPGVATRCTAVDRAARPAPGPDRQRPARPCHCHPRTDAYLEPEMGDSGTDQAIHWRGSGDLEPLKESLQLARQTFRRRCLEVNLRAGDRPADDLHRVRPNADGARHNPVQARMASRKQRRLPPAKPLQRERHLPAQGRVFHDVHESLDGARVRSRPQPCQDDVLPMSGRPPGRAFRPRCAPSPPLLRPRCRPMLRRGWRGQARAPCRGCVPARFAPVRAPGPARLVEREIRPTELLPQPLRRGRHFSPHDMKRKLYLIASRRLATPGLMRLHSRCRAVKDTVIRVFRLMGLATRPRLVAVG